MSTQKRSQAWFQAQTCVFVVARMDDKTRGKLNKAMRQAENERKKKKEQKAKKWRKRYVLNS
jgi:tripartite-type tricarboxylate transporter receptor subunit TctC